jgi:hypothetical protein
MKLKKQKKNTNNINDLQVLYFCFVLKSYGDGVSTN